MASPTARHARPRPVKLTTVRASARLRSGTLLATGAAVAVPGGIASLQSSAHAAPAPAHPSARPTAPIGPVTVTTLRSGSTGPLVRILQERLTGLSADGRFGPLTRAAVLALQQRTGLARDGVVGPLTWSKLGGFPEVAPGAQPGQSLPTSCTHTVVRYGQKGAPVRELQRALGITVDADFGVQTLVALKSFQQTSGLPTDGIAGPLTWSALGGRACAPSTSGSIPELPRPSLPGIGSGQNAATGADVLRLAKKYLGIPYLYGGSTPNGFDCSGLTQHVFRQLGVNLPRTSAQQAAFGPGISLADLRVGDLLFFYSPVRHVAIYAGNAQILDAARPGTSISIHKMWVSPVKASRFLPPG